MPGLYYKQCVSGSARLERGRCRRLTALPVIHASGMFDALRGKLQRVFKALRGLGKMSEENISDALRDVRMALLDADVNFKVARDFIDRVKEKAIGQEVLLSIHPGQQVIKVIHD